MSTVRFALAVVFASSASLLACSAAPETAEEPVAAEETSETSSALMNNGGGGLGLTAGECTGCGCSLVFDHKTDSCRYYKCVCDTDAAAKCAGGKAKLVSVPNPTRSITSAGTVGALAAP